MELTASQELEKRMARGRPKFRPGQSGAICHISSHCVSRPEIAFPLLMFLDGVLYAMGYFERHQQLSVHDYDDGLRAAAREALENAVDFANEPGTREQVRLHPNALMPLSRLTILESGRRLPENNLCRSPAR